MDLTARLPLPVRRLWALTRSVVQNLFRHHAFDHAATLAFYFFLGAIPLLVLLGSLVGNVIQRDGVDTVIAPLYRTMPKVASDFFRHELSAIADADTPTVAPLGLLGFLWLTTNGVHNLMDVFEQLVQAPARSWWRQRLVATIWVLTGLAALTALTWLVLLVNGATAELSARHLPTIFRRSSEFFARGWRRAGVLLVGFGLMSVALALFYRTAVAHPRAVRRRVWAGTFVALILWSLVSWLFGTYVRTIADYAVFYGSLATVAVILLWLYLTSLALVVGAEVNAHLEGMRDGGDPAVADEAREATPS